MKIKPFKKFDGIFLVDNQLATINAVPGSKVYGEQLFKINGVEYREWIPFRSKPAAAIKKGLKIFPLEKEMKILYLGIASSTTASHFSDIIGKKGLIYGVDISQRVLREAIRVAELRGNIIPILSDARRPELYENIVLERVDCLYIDVASPDQVAITIRNAQKFLKPKGYAIIAIKSQSIDVTKKPKTVYNECLKKLEKYFDVLDKVELDPYETAHMFVVMKMK